MELSLFKKRLFGLSLVLLVMYFSISHLAIFFSGIPHLIMCSRFLNVFIFICKSIVLEMCAFIFYMILMLSTE